MGTCLTAAMAREKAFEYLLMLGIEKLIYLPSYIYVCIFYFCCNCFEVGNTYSKENAHDLSIHADVQRLLAGKKQPGN